MGRPTEPLICPKSPGEGGPHNYMGNGECAWCGWKLPEAYQELLARVEELLVRVGPSPTPDGTHYGAAKRLLDEPTFRDELTTPMSEQLMLRRVRLQEAQVHATLYVGEQLEILPGLLGEHE